MGSESNDSDPNPMDAIHMPLMHSSSVVRHAATHSSLIGSGSLELCLVSSQESMQRELMTWHMSAAESGCSASIADVGGTDSSDVGDAHPAIAKATRMVPTKSGFLLQVFI